jgi:threonine/homoserine/homoserine lactone efflux protein
MGQAIGSILPLAIAVAISPVPVIAIVLVLGTPRAHSNGPAFALGWVVGLSVVGAVMLVIATGNATSDSGPSTWTSMLLLAFGVVFLLLGVRTWRGRPRAGEQAAMPKWMAAIDEFSPGKALGAGLLLSGANPKNLALTIAAATTIAQAGVSSSQEAVALAIFVAIGSLTILAALVVFFTMGARGQDILAGLRLWMAAHSAAIMTVLLLVIGAKLIGDAIAGLSA